MKKMIGKIIEEPIEVENIITENKTIEMKAKTINKEFEFEIITVVLPDMRKNKDTLFKRNNCIYAIGNFLTPNRFLLKKAKLLGNKR